jgi:hypothetical protein
MVGEEAQCNPHPSFDAAWYVEQHRQAAKRPLLHHLRVGRLQGWGTDKAMRNADYLPSATSLRPAPPAIAVDVVIPVCRGFGQTRRCLESVLGDSDRPPGRVIIVDDSSPEPELSAWLDRLAQEDAIVLLRNAHNLGFIRSVNAGIGAAGRRDVVLLNIDTEVPAEWLRRLAGHAHAQPRIASVSPLSNNATICSWPSEGGGPIPSGVTLREMDDVAQSVNAGRQIGLSTSVGFCM